MTLTSYLFSQGRHVKRHPVISAVVLVVLTLLAATLMWLDFGQANANAATTAVAWGSANSYGNRALNWAEGNTLGHWYLWGGTGPSYDCSGLVYEAYLHAGIALPRTTYGMLGSSHLVRTYNPQRGDLAFYGSGHVEFVTVLYHMTFGAHDTGTRIGWIRYSGWWQPTMYFRVVR